MLLTVTGEKGSPGATTTALALGHALAGSRLVIEADASGGDLAFRLRRDGRPLPESPTVLTAVAAARSAAGGVSLDGYSHDRHAILGRADCLRLPRLHPGYHAASGFRCAV